MGRRTRSSMTMRREMMMTRYCSVGVTRICKDWRTISRTILVRPELPPQYCWRSTVYDH